MIITTFQNKWLLSKIRKILLGRRRRRRKRREKGLIAFVLAFMCKNRNAFSYKKKCYFEENMLNFMS